VRDRVQHADELDGLVAAWIAAHARDDVVDRFLDARIPVAPVNDLASLAADPHVIARGDVVVIDDDELGPVRMVAPAPRLSATPAEIRWVGPALGAHNDEVYSEWLGLDSDVVGALRETGAI
jgi:crotonobetainyl-CoA:carnitine CoA-transferase CaiB-like acyl-CoA transferase